ncbi:MAG: hypothetical protein ACI8X5_001396 [Planctomycetota bacterium]|jgi:hypothetical protein
MITSLLFLLAIPLPQEPALYVNDGDQLSWAADLVVGENVIILPLTARSERVVRATPTPRGFQLGLLAPSGKTLGILSLAVEAVPHAEGEQLMRFGEEMRLVTETGLPSQARRARDAVNRLPQIARLDLEGCANETLQVAAGPAESELVLIARESESSRTWSLKARSREEPAGALLGLRQGAYGLRLDGSESWELILGDDILDQLFHAQTRAVGTGTALLLRKAEKLTAGNFQWRAHHQRGPRRLAFESLETLERVPAKDLASHAVRLKEQEYLKLDFFAPEKAAMAEAYSLIVRVVVEIGAEGNAVAPEQIVSQASMSFRDQTEVAGLSNVHMEGPAKQIDIRPTMGPGACWGDFDGDGLQDLYVVQGAGRAGSEAPRNRLMRNVGKGRFEAVQGAGDDGAGMGALFFDLDGDGDLDLYVANYGSDVLYRNDGPLGFVDVTSENDMGSDGWSAGISAADYDGDGDLDLYVTTYLVYDTSLMPPVEEQSGYAREDPVEMLPFAFPGAKNTFLENVEGKFVDRTEALGLFDEQGRGMQPIFWDFDLDGDQDLYVANDVSFNVLYRNEGDGSFQDISFLVGLDDPRGGMGVSTGDVDFDGDTDLFLTNWELEANALYRNNLITGSHRKSHTGTFQDVSVYSRLGQHSVGFTSWGGVFFDADNDGDLDLFVPNGYTSPDYESTSICVGQPNQFFLNEGNGRFVNMEKSAGSAVLAPLASRSVAVCDYDGDGRLDLFVTNNNGPYQLLRNEIQDCGHWLGVRLRGKGAGGPSAIGARIELVVDDLTLVREVSLGSGYLAGHADEQHFGLGKTSEVQSLSVLWPSGKKSVHQIAGVDCWVTLVEPEDND